MKDGRVSEKRVLGVECWLLDSDLDLGPNPKQSLLQQGADRHPPGMRRRQRREAREARDRIRKGRFGRKLRSRTARKEEMDRTKDIGGFCRTVGGMRTRREARDRSIDGEMGG